MLQSAEAAETARDYSLAALNYANVAKIQERTNDVELDNTLEKAKQCLAGVNTDLCFDSSPLLSQAIILSIEKRRFHPNLFSIPIAVIAATIRENPDNGEFINACLDFLPQEDLERLKNFISVRERLAIDRILVIRGLGSYMDKSQLEVYTVEKNNLPFFQRLIKEFSPDEVKFVCKLLLEEANFSIPKEGLQLLDNLHMTHDWLGEGDFANQCRKELSLKGISFQSQDFDRQLTQIVKDRIREIVKTNNTQGLVDIFNSNPSNFILTHINVGCLLKSLLGETIDKTYRKSDIEKFVYWVIQMQSRPEEFNRIIHNLGGPVRSSGNNQTQAFLFSLFILPAQEKLRTADGVKFQRSDLYQAGQMMIEVLSKEATDVGQRFKSEKDRLERTIG